MAEAHRDIATAVAAAVHIDLVDEVSANATSTPVATATRRKGQAPPVPILQGQLTTSTKTYPDKADVKRPCAEHNFLTDVADVRQMEKGLLNLLEDFHKGKLQVFGRDCTFERMDQVRERQEKLSRLHFDLDAQQQLNNPDSNELKEMTLKSMNKLVESLDELNTSVRELKTGSIPPRSVSVQSPKRKVKNSARSEQQ